MVIPASNVRVVILLLSVLLLAGVGILMLASTGAYATDGTAEGLGALPKQSIYVGCGLIACFVASRLDYRVYEKLFPWIFGGAVILLALCYVPNVGVERNGESRWVNLRAIGLPMLQMQPSEIGKFAALVFLAWWYARHPLHVASFWKGYVLPGLALSVIILLIAFERDLGTAALISVAAVLVMFTVGVRLVYLLVTGALLAGTLAAVVRMIPERMERWIAFMNLEAHRHGEGLQQWRAKIALGSGGLSGRGYGDGVEKMFYMPYAHTDFIFPMIGEEFGLVGTLGVIFVFIVLVISGMLVAASAPDGFGRTLGAGIVSLIGCQALVNMGVTTALLPNKGMPLPFISYGGSSVVMLFGMIGVLVSIHRQAILQEKPGRGLMLGVPVITPRL